MASNTYAFAAIGGEPWVQAQQYKLTEAGLQQLMAKVTHSDTTPQTLAKMWTDTVKQYPDWSVNELLRKLKVLLQLHSVAERNGPQDPLYLPPTQEVMDRMPPGAAIALQVSALDRLAKEDLDNKIQKMRWFVEFADHIHSIAETKDKQLIYDDYARQDTSKNRNYWINATATGSKLKILTEYLGEVVLLLIPSCTTISGLRKTSNVQLSMTVQTLLHGSESLQLWTVAKVIKGWLPRLLRGQMSVKEAGEKSRGAFDVNPASAPPALDFPAVVGNMSIGRFEAAPDGQSMGEFETGKKADDQVIDAVLGSLANDPRVLTNDISIHGLSTLRQIRDDTTPTSQVIRDSLGKTNKEVFPWVAHETHGVCLILDYACQTISILDPHPDAHVDQACEIHDDMQRTLSNLNMTLGIGQQAIVRDGFPQHENDCGVYMLGWVEALLSRQFQLGDLGSGDLQLLTLRDRYSGLVFAEVMSQMLRQGALNASQAGADEVMMGMDEGSEDGQGDE